MISWYSLIIMLWDKFTKKFKRLGMICLGSLFFCGMQSKADPLLVVSNFGSPFSALRVEMDSFKTRGIVSEETSVDQVLTLRTMTQICPPVIQSIPVFMVNFIDRPLIGHIENSQSSSPIESIINTNQSITIMVINISCFISDGDPVRIGHETLENSSFWVIVQQLSKPVGGQHVPSHETCYPASWLEST